MMVADGICTCGAQLATVGYLTGAAGITFPGEIAGGVSFAGRVVEMSPSAAAVRRLAKMMEQRHIGFAA